MFTLICFHYSDLLPQPVKTVWFNTKCLSSWEMEHAPSHQQCFCLQVQRSTGFMLQPVQALPHRFLSSTSGSGSRQFCQHCQRCIFVHTVSLNLLCLGTESPFCVRSTSPLPEPDPSPKGFHRWEVFLGVGSWLGKKAHNEISIWICEVGSVSCEHSHRHSHCFRAPYDRAVNKSAGTNTSIHHSIPLSPRRIITTLKTNCLALFCVSSYIHWLSFSPWFD